MSGSHQHEHEHGEKESSCGCSHDHEHGGEDARGWVVAAGALTGAGLLCQWLVPGLPWLARAAELGAIAAGGWLIFPTAVRSLRRFRLDINVLMTVAVAGALFLGDWAEAAAVVFLFSLAELLEGLSASRAKRAISDLLKLTPPTALVLREGRTVEVPVEEVKTGEWVAVQAGQRIPLDGLVREGDSSVNQAPITGESVPVDKAPGASVFAGTINGEGALRIEVTKGAGDSTLARIIRMVGEAQEQRAPTQRFIEQFAVIYTPAVMVLAILVAVIPPLLFSGLWNEWLYRACALLVIACPCALVIATPVSIVSGLTALARRGVLVKGGAYLEMLGKLKALAVDKTGTITEGKPKVQEVIPWKNGTAEETVRIAAGVDQHSPHPLALAVMEYAEEKKITLPAAGDFKSKTGRGGEAIIEGHRYLVGNHRFVHEQGLCSPELETLLQQIESRAQSVVIVAHQPHEGCAGEVLGVLSVGDGLRPNAARAVQALKEAGVWPVVMLSGDNQRTAEAIARQAGIERAYGDLLPEQKVEKIKELEAEYKVVGMIGDGVNDAPALAASSLGIAMGAAGTDTAIETADLALMQDDLEKLAEAVRMGRRTLAMIRFNVGFALVVKAVFLVLAVTGYTSLWLAILADTGATLLVIANSLRLLRGV